jgi:ATP-dependent Clp protease adaptor protein ClpS
MKYYELNKEYTEGLAVLQQVELEEPPRYQVYLENDDFTPMEFVISLLENIFYMDRRKATDLMLEAHIKGKAVCGIYTKEVAETKQSQAAEYARSNGHPLVCSMEAVKE